MTAPTDTDTDTGAAPAGDLELSYAPLSGMVVDPSGTVSYDFEGHIKAQGLDFDTVQWTGVGPLPPDQSITWLEVGSGGVLADVRANDLGGAGWLQMRATIPPNEDTQTTLSLATGDVPGSNIVAEVVTPTTDAALLLLDGTGNSDFCQLIAGAVKTYIVALGAVTVPGSLAAGGTANGTSVVNLSSTTGTFNFARPFGVMTEGASGGGRRIGVGHSSVWNATTRTLTITWSFENLSALANPAAALSWLPNVLVGFT